MKIFISLQLNQKRREIFAHQNFPKKVRKNHVDFPTREITLKKLRGKNVDVSTSAIASKKVRGNNVDSLTSEITPKKVCGKTTWIFRPSELRRKKSWK